MRRSRFCISRWIWIADPIRSRLAARSPSKRQTFASIITISMFIIVILTMYIIIGIMCLAIYWIASRRNMIRPRLQQIEIRGRGRVIKGVWDTSIIITTISSLDSHFSTLIPFCLFVLSETQKLSNKICNLHLTGLKLYNVS